MSRFANNQQLFKIGSHLPWLVVLVLFAGGCAVNPVTGKTELSLISPQQEVAIGEQNYQPSQQSQGGLYQVDPGLNDYVNSVGQRLAEVSHQPNFPYEFVVLNNDIPNAWALPGGKIAINRGLLIHLEDEAQLASVLGHEVAHVTARHSASRMTQGALLGVGTQVLGQATRDSDYGELILVGAGAGAAAWQARYSREDELEADRLGMGYMTQLGYDPMGAVELQQTFVRLSENRNSDFISGLFASHPPSQQRVDANRSRAQQLSGSQRNREAFNKATAQLRKDKQAYETHEQAIAALQNDNVERALTLTEQAIAAQPKENHFWETKAHLHVLRKEHNQAQQAFGKAIDLNPQYFSPYLGRGSLRYQLQDWSGAEQDLLASQRWLNTPTSNLLLGQVKLKQGDRQAAVQYLQVAAGAGGDVGKAAQQQLQQLGVADAQ